MAETNQNPPNTLDQRAFYQTPEELQDAINDYFQTCKEGKQREILTKKGEVVIITQGTPLTIAGLAYHLGFQSRQSILDYDKREDFSCVISRARLYIETDNINKGLTGEYESKTNNLNLISNYGYSQKIEITVKDKAQPLTAEEDKLLETEYLKEIGQVKRITGG